MAQGSVTADCILPVWVLGFGSGPAEYPTLGYVQQSPWAVSTYMNDAHDTAWTMDSNEAEGGAGRGAASRLRWAGAEPTPACGFGISTSSSLLSQCGLSRFGFNRTGDGLVRSLGRGEGEGRRRHGNRGSAFRSGPCPCLPAALPLGI